MTCNKHVWNIGDRVNSVGGNYQDGEIIGVIHENGITILNIKWPDGTIDQRSSWTLINLRERAAREI
jgi:hypothetical protein